MRMEVPRSIDNCNSMFERLRVYKATLLLESEVRQLIRHIKCDRNLLDQLLRAVLSVKLNVAESAGYRFNGKKILAYEIARASSDETRAALNELVARGYATEKQIQRAISLTRVIAKMLTGMIRKVETEMRSRKTETEKRSRKTETEKRSRKTKQRSEAQLRSGKSNADPG